MKRILPLFIIFGIGLSLGAPINPKDVKLQCSSSNVIKCPLSGKSNPNYKSPFSCPKSGKSSQCQKTFINFIFENEHEKKFNDERNLVIELFIDNSLIQSKSQNLFNKFLPHFNSDPPINLPLII